MNPIELVEHAIKVRDEQKLEWLTICVPREGRTVRRRFTQVLPGCRGQVIGSGTHDRNGTPTKELIVSVQISELLIAAAKIADHFEAVAVDQAARGLDDEADETMRQYKRLKELLWNIPTTKGKRKRKPRKGPEDARGA